MAGISRKVRNDLFNDLKTKPSPFERGDDNSTLLDFVSRVWDLRTMPSTDIRFPDAYGDIFQHVVNNHDWDHDFLFLERLDLLNSNDETFAKFLETIVSPEFKTTED